MKTTVINAAKNVNETKMVSVVETGKRYRLNGF